MRSIVLGRAEAKTATSDSLLEFEDFRTTSFERWKTLTPHLDPTAPEQLPNGYLERSTVCALTVIQVALIWH